MFGKLLKYDLRSMWKQFGLVWPAALVLAVVNRLFLQARHPFEPNDTLGNKATDLMMLVFFCVLVAMFVLTVVYIVQRFYKGLLGDEGYLIHTLPVKPAQLIGSKLTCAMVVILMGVFVSLLSVFLMITQEPMGVFRSLADTLKQYKQLAQEHSINLLPVLLEWLAAMLTSMARVILQLYLAMALGHLFSKNRVAASMVAYVVINTAVTALSDLTLGTGTGVTLTTVVLQASDAIQITGQQPYLVAFNNLLLISLLAEVVLSVVFFLITNYILKNKLNLE